MAWLAVNADAAGELTAGYKGGGDNDFFEFSEIPGMSALPADFVGDRFIMPARTATLLRNEAPRFERVFLPVHKVNSHRQVMVGYAIGIRADGLVQPLHSCIDTAESLFQTADRMIARGELASRADLFERLADPAQHDTTVAAFEKVFFEPRGSVPTSTPWPMVPWDQRPPEARSVLDEPAVMYSMIQVDLNIEIPQAWTKLKGYGICTRTSIGQNSCIGLDKSGKTSISAYGKPGEDIEVFLGDGRVAIENSYVGTLGKVPAAAIAPTVTLNLVVRADKVSVSDPQNLIGPDTITVQQ